MNRRLLIAIVAILGGCRQSTAGQAGSAKMDSAMDGDLLPALTRVRGARVFFSHHSVGADLLEGMGGLAAAAGSPLKLMSLDQAATDPGPGWLDAEGGVNKDPRGKIDFFADAIRHRTELKPKLAFMKFCFVDFNPHTNVDELFAHYESTLGALEKEHPEITFAHVTVPLSRRPTELKWRIRRVLGRMVWEDEANVKREQFNQRLLERFRGDPIFDLARLESTRLDGSREAFEHGGGVVHSLDPEYARDEGHLNDLGKRRLGGELVRFVAKSLPPADSPTISQKAP
jgi:hypothetical protein